MTEFTGQEKRADQLTVRDHFAMAALSGLLASPRAFVDKIGTEINIPDMAFELADNMLAQRNKTNDE